MFNNYWNISKLIRPALWGPSRLVESCSQHVAADISPEHIWSMYPSRIRAYFRIFFGRGVPKSIFARSGSKSVFRTHKYHQTAQNFETNPMGPVPGSETQISRKKSWNFLIGVRILLGYWACIFVSMYWASILSMCWVSLSMFWACIFVSCYWASILSMYFEHVLIKFERVLSMLEGKVLNRQIRSLTGGLTLQ